MGARFLFLIMAGFFLTGASATGGARAACARKLVPGLVRALNAPLRAWQRETDALIATEATMPPVLIASLRDHQRDLEARTRKLADMDLFAEAENLIQLYEGPRGSRQMPGAIPGHRVGDVARLIADHRAFLQGRFDYSYLISAIRTLETTMNNIFSTLESETANQAHLTQIDAILRDGYVEDAVPLAVFKELARRIEK